MKGAGQGAAGGSNRDREGRRSDERSNMCYTPKKVTEIQEREIGGIGWGGNEIRNCS